MKWINLRYATPNYVKIWADTADRHEHWPSQNLISMAMNLKRIFGFILTLLGIIGLIYAAVSFVNANSANARDVKSILTFGILGFIFFIAGIGLIRNTQDKTNT